MTELGLKCTGIQFNMYFDPVINIRERASELELKFKDLFPAGFTILPNMGDTVPLEIPRIIGNDERSFYNLNVSAVSANITQNVVDNSLSIDAVMDSFRSKIDSLYNAMVEIIPAKRILFCGITTQFSINIEDDAVEFLKSRLLKLDFGTELFDLETKFTFIQEEKYYINMVFNNVRGQNLDSIGLNLQVDINDRYRFNRSYASNNTECNSNLTNALWSEVDVVDHLYLVYKDVMENRIKKFLILKEC